MSNRSGQGRIQLSDIGSTQAKVIFLGDSNTGKTELIKNLESPSRQSEESRNDGFFTIIEIPPEELENTSSSVVLKIWERSNGVSKQEEELAFRGALFCIITLDIRNPESASAALNKWANLRESKAPESFLFIVGTHLDQASHRRVELKEICKACAKRDAIYVEVSNSSLANMALFRKLIKQRLNYMLYRKEVIAQRPFTQAVPNDDDYGVESLLPSTEENKHEGGDATHTRRFSALLGGNTARTALNHVAAPHQDHERNLSVQALEPNVLSGSVGSILASHMGTEFWPGLEEEGDELEQIGWKIGSFIEQLSSVGVNESTLATASAALMDDAFYGTQHFRQSAPALPPSPSGKFSSPRGLASAGNNNPADSYVDSDYSISDLRAAFEIMGLTLPASLNETQEGNQAQMASSAALDSTPRAPTSSASAYLRKMVVKLPDGTSADMILDLDSNIEQQIELFLLSNSLAGDDEARQKLVSIGRQVQMKYNVKVGRPSAVPQPYPNHGHSHSSPSDSSTAGGSSGMRRHRAAGNNVPFGSSGSGGGGHHAPVPMDDDTSLADSTAGNSHVHGHHYHNSHPNHNYNAATAADPAKKFKLRIALDGASAPIEVVVRTDDDAEAVAQSITVKYKLDWEQSERVHQHLAKALGQTRY